MTNKLFFRLIFIFCLSNCFLSLKGQEILFPLSGNPVIKEYLRKNNSTVQPTLRTHAVADTFEIGDNTHPFIDDFSRKGIYPFDSLWCDSDAFINSTFCDHPITIGVATLDGIDKNGNPHEEFSSISDSSDFLTSVPINFDTSNTGIWLSFYYQPQGLGDEPEVDDSLTLQF